MAIVGLRTAEDYIAQYKDRPENWRMGILMLEPNGSAPIYALTSMGKSSATDDPVFHWFEEERNAYRMQMSADLDATGGSDTVSLVSGGTLLKIGDILRVEQTEELLEVTAVTSDTSITVTRGVGGSTVAAVTVAGAGVNPNLLLVGSAYEEGSDAPAGRTYNASERSNQCQIFRDTFQVTNTSRETNMRTGDTVKEDKRRCFDKHQTAIERAVIFGRKATTTRNGRVLRYMDGIVPQIPAGNIVAPGGNFSMAADGSWELQYFEDYLRHIFTYGSNEKMAYCGNRFLLAVQQVCRRNSQYELSPIVKEYGMNVRRVTTPFGELVMKTHPQFNEVSSGITTAVAYSAMDTWGLIIDWKFLKYRYMRNRDTKYEPDLTQKGQDGLQAGYITECSIELEFAKCFGLIKGWRSGAADT